jgi:glycosyltransferase involved in cell wall biosynthesis
MRILQVHNRHRQRGGEDVAVEEEHDLLVSGGHQVEQVVFDNPTTPLATTGALARSAWNPASARDVLRAARRFDADVVHVHNTWFALSPAVFAVLRRAGFPTVATLHNFRTACVNGLLLRDGLPCRLCVGTHPGRAVLHRCYRDSAVLSAVSAAAIVVPRVRGTWRRDVGVFIALDESAVPDLVASGIPGDRIVVRPNTVADPGPRHEPPSRSDQVVYAGRLSSEKGAEVLVESWCRARPERLRLTVFGDGPLRGPLEALAVPGITFAGQVGRDRLSSVLLGARALVFPSICREMSPLAPIEAAAAGLPLIASETVDAARRLTAAGAGWTVAPGDPAALAAALGRLGESDAVDAAGRAARDLYSARHDPSRALASLEAAYEAAIWQLHDTKVNGDGSGAYPV